ncbi:hypothetical protein LPJ53_003482 [Coemansia erecta]|uniref:ARM repeat-containing protein n=1 Tax=Coemansia erecta TaxID=147472 RepID=A0A9W7XZU2_9FUNG|nr:hypothetical protein LPJ53_003482 [Coemansia erecta]
MSGTNAHKQQQHQQHQQQTLDAGLQPLFDSSVSLSYDRFHHSDAGGKADSARVLTPPSAAAGAVSAGSDASTSANASVFGMLPAIGTSGRMSLDQALGSHLPTPASGHSAARMRTGSVAAQMVGGGHGRTASYGTSLLDTLNEEKQARANGNGSGGGNGGGGGHNRSATAAGSDVFGRSFGLGGGSGFSLLSHSDPAVGGGARHAAHMRSHTMGTSPPPVSGAAAAAVASTNASGMLGAHARLGSLSNAGGGGGLLSASALRSSYSTASLRSAFARRSDSPLSGAEHVAAAGDGLAPFDFAASLSDGVWGPSGLSTELDILGSSAAADVAGAAAATGDGGALARQTGDAYARIRSYSFNGPPDGIADAADEPDIDVLHAAAKAQNPSLAFRKLMARTHARSKTMATPLGGADLADPAAAALAGGTAHLGIGGAGGGAGTGGLHRRGASTATLPAAAAAAAAAADGAAGAHSRQHSGEVGDDDAADGGVPTRSLWVGNVDPALSSQDLVALFGKYGRVESLRLLPDKECAFVNFMRTEDAVQARRDMRAGARIGNATVRVGFGKGEAHASGDAQAMQPTRALWIGNIAATVSADALGAVFAAYGRVESARVLAHKNCGFVNFERLEDAVRAKQAMNGKPIDALVVRIGYAKVPPAKSDGGAAAAAKLRNPVPSAAPLTASGQRAEADAIAGTTQSGLGTETVLEPGFSLAIDEDLVAFPYATHLPPLPPPRVAIRADDAAAGDSAPPPGGSPGSAPALAQARLRDVRRMLEATAPPLAQADFDRVAAELLPHAVDLCTDYVGNVVVQKLAERGGAALKLELIRRVAPHMAAIGVHKNGTWAVQKLIDTAHTREQRRAVVDSIRAHAPQLLLDQLGNYVVQGCLKFGAPADDSADARRASNQFAFDAIHARCVEIAQGRFGARAIRTCLESPSATKLQQKLVAVALVTNAVALATNANGHLLMTWLLDASRFPGRFRVLAHQLAPHLRYLATHKLGAGTVTKLVDQDAEPDARDLILNTLFFNPDPTVLDDVLLDHAQGVPLVLKILQGNAIGDAEKARIADRLRFLLHAASPPEPRASATPVSSGSASAPAPASASAPASGLAPPMRRLADAVAATLAHSQPVYPPVAAGAGAAAGTAAAMPMPQHVQHQHQHQHHPFSSPPHAGGFHPMMPMPMPMPITMGMPAQGAGAGAVAMSYPAGYGGMVGGAGGQPPHGNELFAAYYMQAQGHHHPWQQQQQQQQMPPPPQHIPAFYGAPDEAAASASAAPTPPSSGQ